MSNLFTRGFLWEKKNQQMVKTGDLQNKSKTNI